jgi:hypothetical protein
LDFWLGAAKKLLDLAIGVDVTILTQVIDIEQSGSRVSNLLD